MVKDLECRIIPALSFYKKEVLEDKKGNLYILEDDVLYDLRINYNGNITKGPSHRMSRLNLIIT